MRFFRSSPAVYEQVRVQLDAAFGNPQGLTVSCIEPAATAPRDSQGRIIVAVQNEFCDYEAAATILPQLLASGAVEEIMQAEYVASLPSPPPEGDEMR